MELEDYTESARILDTIIGLTRNTVYISYKTKRNMSRRIITD